MKINRKKEFLYSAMAILGTVETAIAAHQAAVKSYPILSKRELSFKDKVKAVWKNYILTAVSGGVTVGCIVLADKTSKKTEMKLLQSYLALNTLYEKYREKTIKKYGEEQEKKLYLNSLKDAMVKVKAKNSENEKSNKQSRIFYDAFADRYFESSLDDIIDAEYKINQDLHNSGIASLNAFYKYLGQEPIELFDTLGWSLDENYIYWIDILHTVEHLDDGMEVCMIDFAYDPTTNWLNHEVKDK